MLPMGDVAAASIFYVDVLIGPDVIEPIVRGSRLSIPAK
jgi:hypothetical protein